MGCLLLEAQEELLAVKFEQVVVMLDGDEPGRQATTEIVVRLTPRMWVRAATLPEDKQPDELSGDELKQMLTSL